MVVGEKFMEGGLPVHQLILIYINFITVTPRSPPNQDSTISASLKRRLMLKYIRLEKRSPPPIPLQPAFIPRDTAVTPAVLMPDKPLISSETPGKILAFNFFDHRLRPPRQKIWQFEYINQTETAKKKITIPNYLSLAPSFSRNSRLNLMPLFRQTMITSISRIHPEKRPKIMHQNTHVFPAHQTK